MKKRTKSLICLLICLIVLAAAVAVAAVILTAPKGQQAPEVPETGESAGAWAKNAQGFYFNDAGEAILPAVEKGIDVSKYQGEIDWQKAKAAGIDFAVLRCGIGSEWNGEGDAAEYTQDDTYWRTNADACTALGIPFGTYLYSYATTEEQARSEADHVARLLGLIPPAREGLADYTAAPYQLSLPVYYDLEDKAITGLYPEEMAALVTAFFDQLKKNGYTGEEGLYASLNWVRARFSDPAFDAWRDQLWVARYASALNYTGAYSMWQCTYQEPGESYGVQSETVDLDFRMEELAITGVGEGKSDTAAAAFTNGTYKCELWMAAPGDTASLTLDEPAEADGGQKVFWAVSDETVAKINKKGVIKAVAEGECVLTATLADGRKSIACTLRVGSVTVPVLATGSLRGEVAGMEYAAALKAELRDAILLDAGGSLQGTARTALTGGMDMTYTFADAGYDLQAFDAADLAFGAERLRSDAVTATGPALAANLLTEEGEPLFARSTSWNRNRISNGRNYVVCEAGKRIGFFALCSTGNAVGGSALTAADPAETAARQVAALRAQGADAILCITGADTPSDALLGDLAGLGVTAVIDGSKTENDTAGALPVLAAATAGGGVAQLDLTFAPDGSVTAAPQPLNTAEALAAYSWGENGAKALANMQAELQKLEEGDAEIRGNTLFTLTAGEGNDGAGDARWDFRAFIGGCWLDAAVADAENIPAEYGGLPVAALVPAAGAETVELGYDAEVTRGALEALTPAGERLWLVTVDGAALTAFAADEGSYGLYTPADGAAAVADAEALAAAGPVLLLADTGTLAALDSGARAIRDYGDAFWTVRMAVSDATGAFTAPLALASPARPESADEE